MASLGRLTREPASLDANSAVADHAPSQACHSLPQSPPSPTASQPRAQESNFFAVKLGGRKHSFYNHCSLKSRQTKVRGKLVCFKNKWENKFLSPGDGKAFLIV